MKVIKVLGVVILVLLLVYFVGPKPDFEPLPGRVISPMNMTLDSLAQYVQVKERGLAHLKPGNESQIVWADSMRKTRYSVVYLHGFTASPMESNPTHFEFAKRLGFNLYLPLLPGHGLDDRESFKNLTPNHLVEAAKEAIAIGQLLGEDVIVMSCSTGSTLAIYLAGANKEMIDVLLMYSPNIELADPNAKLITGHWGPQIVKGLVGDYMEGKDEPGDGQQYWTTTYRSEGLMTLQGLLDQTMNAEVFTEVTQPYFLGYYYKNEQEQDFTVSTQAMQWFDARTSTPEPLKKMIAFPDAGEHVITNPIKAKHVEAVLDSTFVFARRILQN